jgi:hypothetical protein
MANRGQYPAGEVYTIGQVAELTGAPTDTIRSWERRYGVPSPIRAPNGQRRYTPDDVRFVSILQRQRENGRTMEQAIQDAWAGAEPVRGAGNPLRPFTPENVESLECDTLVEALASLDFAGARTIVGRSIVGLGPGYAALELLYPAKVALDRLQLEGYVATAHARAGLAWLHRKMHACLDAASPERERPPGILVGAQHDATADFPGLAIACCLAESGAETTWSGSGLSGTDIDALIHAMRPAAVVLVAGSPAGEIATRATASRLANASPDSSWSGTVAVAGTTEDLPAGVIQVPFRAAEAVSAILAAIESRAGRTRTMGER